MNIETFGSGKKLTVKDVPAIDFITAFAAYLKKSELIKEPNWLNFVKSSCKRELAPYDVDWLYVRAASIARKVYLRHNLGVGSLKHLYGGKARRGVRTPRHGTASKKVIRYCLQ